MTAQVHIFRIDLVNGEKIGYFTTSVHVNRNQVKQFKKDVSALFTVVLKRSTEAMLCIETGEK